MHHIWNYSAFYILHLVNPATDGVVQDARDKEALDVARLDVELSRDELDLDPGVRLDQLDQHLEIGQKYESEEIIGSKNLHR